MALITHYY